MVGIPGLILIFAGLTNTNIGIHVSEPVVAVMGAIALVGIFSGIAASIIKPK